MNNNNSGSEKEAQSTRPVGHGAPIYSIKQVKLTQSQEGSIVSLTFPEDNTYELRQGHTVTLGTAITGNDHFVITIALNGESGPVPPATLELENGEVVLAEGAENAGWNSKTPHLFDIGTHEFTTEIVFTEQGADAAEQEIILVGTVPTP